MFEAALDGSFKGLYCKVKIIAQSDPDTQHVDAAFEAMECVIVQDMFLNETAKFAHVFLPGSSFLEKNGTFHQCRTPHLARAQSDAAAGGLRGLGSHPCWPMRWVIR